MTPPQNRKRVLTAPPLPVRPAFKTALLDFERGIRMGGLEPHERITQIVKAALVTRHAQDFIIDKYGRGRYWGWICWVPRADRAAKTVSAHYNFGCAKFFVRLDTDKRQLEAGLWLERAEIKRRAGPEDVRLEDDWDWHRLVRGLRAGTPLAKELQRLIAVEGFHAAVGAWPEMKDFAGVRWGDPAALRRRCTRLRDDGWGIFELYYPLPEKELAAMDGSEIIAAILAIFDEVAPAMNRVMPEPYLTAGSA